MVKSSNIVKSGNKKKTKVSAKTEKEKAIKIIRDSKKYLKKSKIDKNIQKSLDCNLIKSLFEIIYNEDLITKDEYNKLIDKTNSRFNIK